MHLGLKKRLALEAHRLYRHNEIKTHPLTYFFWECTLRCNLHCQHCGSDCVADAIPDMPREDFMKVLDGLAPHIDPRNFAVVITGGVVILVNSSTVSLVAWSCHALRKYTLRQTSSARCLE